MGGGRTWACLSPFLRRCADFKPLYVIFLLLLQQQTLGAGFTAALQDIISIDAGCFFSLVKKIGTPQGLGLFL